MVKVTKKAILALAILLSGYGELWARIETKEDVREPRIVVLQPADPVPQDAERIQKIEIGGNNSSADCSYLEIMETIKGLAAQADANIIKINQHDRRTSMDCARVVATLYKVSDTRSAETEFIWNKNRKLSWNDFRGPISNARHDDVTAAATFCGFGFETNAVGPNERPKVVVYNSFYTNKSWVRPEERKPDVLIHEQGHFDLCEIYTRKLRQRIEKARITGSNLKSTLRKIYNEVQDEYVRRQQQYEDDTEHSLNKQGQAKWVRIIERELAETEEWMLTSN